MEQHNGSSTIGDAHGVFEGGQHAHESHPVYVVLLPLFIQAAGVCVFFLLTRYIHFLPYTAVMFIIGTLMGIGSLLDQNSPDQLTQSILQWSRIDYEVLFCVFLPGLLFKDALEINFHLFTVRFHISGRLRSVFLLLYNILVLLNFLPAVFPISFFLNLSG